MTTSKGSAVATASMAFPATISFRAGRDRNGAEVLDRAARLFEHVRQVGPRYDGYELEPFRIDTAIFMGPVVVGAAERRPELGVL